MKFGLHYQVPCSASQSPVQRYRDTLDQAAYAEALGFESVWPVEQHFIPDLSIMPAPMLLLAAIAERTPTAGDRDRTTAAFTSTAHRGRGRDARRAQ
jgi:hypothetical protein